MSATEAFGVIGIPPTDDWGAIVAAHREAVRQVHPDSNPASKGRAADLLHQETTRLNEARDVLRGYREQGRSLVDEVRIETESAKQPVEETHEDEDPFYGEEVPDTSTTVEDLRQWHPTGGGWGGGVPVRRARWRKPVFWIGLALASFCSWASTRPELAPDAEQRMAARFWALVGMSLVLVATMASLRSALRGRRRRSGSRVSMAPVAVAALAVGVLVPVGGVAIYRAISDETSSAGDTSLPVGDPCLVGTWRASRMVSNGAVVFRGGAGAILTIEASGRAHTDYAQAASLKGSADGSTVLLRFQGHYTAQLRATKGKIRETDADFSHLTLLVTQHGREEAWSPVADTATWKYACSPTTFTMGQAAFTRQAA